VELAAKPPEVKLRWAMGQVAPQFLGRVTPLEVEARLAVVLGVEREAAESVDPGAPIPPAAGTPTESTP
jgi:hypothetical protein